MPLSKPNGGFQSLPYSLKIAIVESNCTGCPCFAKIDTERAEESEYGCVFPRDIELLNTHIREPYLTVSEIASNTCEFWKNHTKWEIDAVDSTPGYELDLALTPKSARFLQASAPGNILNLQVSEVIPQTRFSDNRDNID
jgi:hypothetical protein